MPESVILNNLSDCLPSYLINLVFSPVYLYIIVECTQFTNLPLVVLMHYTVIRDPVVLVKGSVSSRIPSAARTWLPQRPGSAHVVPSAAGAGTGSHSLISCGTEQCPARD